MRIGLAYNEKPEPASTEDPDSSDDAYAEWDDPATIAAVEQALGLFGSVIRLEADQFLPQKLALSRPDLVFNMAEGFRGQSREALVPSICEYLSIPYTGSAPSRALAAQGPHQGDARLPRRSHRPVRVPRDAGRRGPDDAAVSGVREARGRGIRQGRVQQQLVRRRRGAAGARPVPGRALRGAGAGRYVPPGSGIHGRDSR